MNLFPQLVNPCILLPSLFIRSSLLSQCTQDINLSARTNSPMRNYHQKFFRSFFPQPPRRDRKQESALTVINKPPSFLRDWWQLNVVLRDLSNGGWKLKKKRKEKKVQIEMTEREKWVTSRMPGVFRGCWGCQWQHWRIRTLSGTQMQKTLFFCAFIVFCSMK